MTKISILVTGANAPDIPPTDAVAIFTAPDAETAIEKLLQGHFDAVLTDTALTEAATRKIQKLARLQYDEMVMESFTGATGVAAAITHVQQVIRARYKASYSFTDNAFANAQLPIDIA